jgi:hypothetical protein
MGARIQVMAKYASGLLNECFKVLKIKGNTNFSLLGSHYQHNSLVASK